MNTTAETLQSNSTFLPYYLHSTAVVASYIVAYFLIFVLCMVGNGLVCFVVLQNHRMRTVTNLFILNLAISDLLVGIFCVPTTLVDNLITGWPFSQFMCTMSGLIQGMSVSASVFTLVAIALDRFFCIVYPFRQKMSMFKAVLAIAFIWMLAFAIMCPSATMLTVIHLKDTYVIQNNDTYPLFTCYEDWPYPEMRTVYTTILFVHIYLMPLGLISLMYGRIVVKLFSKLGPVGQRSRELQEERNSVSKKKVKIIKMLIIVTMLFMVSWLPLWTLMLLTDYRDLSEEQIDFLSSYVFPFAHWLAFFNSGVNPIIYGFFNENFKRGFQAAISFRFCSLENIHQEVYTQRTPWSSGFSLHNKVSNGESLESTVCKVTNRKGIPQGTPKGTQGINLEDISRITTRSGVCTAWEE
ncbi:NPFF2 protein, partial [Atractosteus spatula]|nr:NPFF2 protein [Atractosteus spatula]